MAPRGPIQTLVAQLGLDDPAQLVATGRPPASAPLAALAGRFPRFARALQGASDGRAINDLSALARYPRFEA